VGAVCAAGAREWAVRAVVRISSCSAKRPTVSTEVRHESVIRRVTGGGFAMADLAAHLLKTGADGRLKGMSAPDVIQAVDAAVAHGNLVLHFHGGLVNEAAGEQIARALLPVYADAGAYPVFFAWRSGLLEVLSGNLREIIREELFDRIMRRVLRWTVGKVRQEEAGGRAISFLAATLPDRDEMLTEIGLRGAGAEPFADVQPPRGADDFGLSADEQAAFEREMTADPTVSTALAGALRAAGMTTWGAAAGAREAVPELPAKPSQMDTEVLAEIAVGEEAGARGLMSTAVLARKAARALERVLVRYRHQTEHGAYPTVLEEVLREFYVSSPGVMVWETMKKETADTFAAGAGDRGGRLVLDRLAERLRTGARPKLTLVGHSTGAVFINNLLADAAAGGLWPADVKVQVVYLAPACTCAAFADMLDVGEQLIERFRMFTMTDEAERSDHLIGALYPRSLLYLVSGALEREGHKAAHVPVLGQSRYLWPAGQLTRLLASDAAKHARLNRVRTFLAQRDRAVLSPTGAGAPAGQRAGARTHASFDDDDLVRQSLAALIGNG